MKAGPDNGYELIYWPKSKSKTIYKIEFTFGEPTQSVETIDSVKLAEISRKQMNRLKERKTK